MSTLPTTPVGKQQLIDMKAGAILRGHARKSERYLGCPVRLLLTFIVLIKSSLICGWLVREYFYFDFQCTLLSSSSSDGEMVKRRSADVLRIPVFSADGPPLNYYGEEFHERVKRSPFPQEAGLDPRKKSAKHRKKEVLQGVPTTMYTMTNTQLLPADGDSLRMKTIRNRVKPISEVGDDDDMLELDIDSPPLVYITKIQKRGEEKSLEDRTFLEKPRKRKGKGKKKKKKLGQSAPISTEEPPPVPKKRKGGHKKKQNRLDNRTGSDRAQGTSEQTKSPRHLLSSPGVPHFTTPRPHQSSFLHGAIDPKDPRFSNKGHIRGYPMHVASRKPTPSSRLSEETRLMWQMDELNYTTHAAALKTTAMTKLKEEEEEAPTVPVVHLPLPTAESETTTPPPTKRSFYSTHTLSTWRLTAAPPTTTTTMIPVTRTPWVPSGVETEEEKRLVAIQVPLPVLHREKSTLERLNSELPSAPQDVQQQPTRPPRPVKHGFDRSLDEAIDSGVFNYPPDRSLQHHQHHEDSHKGGDFQSQLSTFSSSATCIARTMFDLWCACQLLTLFPYLVGVCVARRSLFVSHLVLDILLLVIGFVYTITMIVFSVVLYVLVGEMPKEVLFEWILFALLLDAVLLLYACLVVISLRCCERIVQCRLTMKLQTPSTAAEAEQV
ncbi:hypothetical protein V3C99_003746 [Haemonchus contortus]